VKRLLSRKSVHIEWAFIDHAPIGRGTIFIFRSKFLSYRGRGSTACALDSNGCPFGQAPHAGDHFHLRNNFCWLILQGRRGWGGRSSRCRGQRWEWSDVIGVCADNFQKYNRRGPVRLWLLTGVCQTHENKKLGVRVRGTSFGLERGIRCGIAIRVAVRWEGDARARHRGSQGRRGRRDQSLQR